MTLIQPPQTFEELSQHDGSVLGDKARLEIAQRYWYTAIASQQDMATDWVNRGAKIVALEAEIERLKGYGHAPNAVFAETLHERYEAVVEAAREVAKSGKRSPKGFEPFFPELRAALAALEER